MFTNVKQDLQNHLKDFATLKSKYQATKYPDSSLSSLLLLNKLNKDENIIEPEYKWLEQQGLTETIAIAQNLEKTREFKTLKSQYKATQYDDSSPNSHLYKLLKRLNLGNQLSEQDINFLK
ncbi:hypothetical protein NIES22_40080 [Calothrix brevissima NIES-22]|nr:hypothetical protein NIES22_40080 [Calothrix brevissima NIES-22]